MKRRKALRSEEKLLETKSARQVRALLKHMSRLSIIMRTHIIMISINTYRLACTRGSALQCCSFYSERILIADTKVLTLLLFIFEVSSLLCLCPQLRQVVL